jgi:hypothetical protein
MVPQWVGVAVLVLPLGLVLGYWSAKPRVKVLEKQLILLGLELDLEKSKVEGLRREWQKEKEKVQELRLALGLEQA